jgi:hypothetical protein
VGGRPFRTNKHLLAMSALMPPTCSSIASFTVCLIVLKDIYAAPLCLPIFTLENVGRFKQADCFPFVGVGLDRA